MTSIATAQAVRESASYVSDYDAIVETMNRYNDAVRSGVSAGMKPSFHDKCTFYGYFDGQLLAGPIQLLFDWVDGNGPCAAMQIRFASIDVHDTIAVVRLEMENVTGKLAGAQAVTLTDLFQLIKVDGTWVISQKSFHQHPR
jgi:hypothetical protein